MADDPRMLNDEKLRHAFGYAGSEAPRKGRQGYLGKIKAHIRRLNEQFAELRKSNEHWQKSPIIWHHCAEGKVRHWPAVVCSMCRDGEDFDALKAYRKTTEQLAVMEDLGRVMSETAHAAWKHPRDFADCTVAVCADARKVLQGDTREFKRLLDDCKTLEKQLAAEKQAVKDLGVKMHEVAHEAAEAKEHLIASERERLKWCELVAMLCGDGGHYHQKHGTDATLEYCQKRFCGLLTENDALLGLVLAYRDGLPIDEDLVKRTLGPILDAKETKL